MPIYEYRCQQGHNFEVMQRMSDDPVISCETCASPVQRVFHPVAVHFKGKGFYNTDYGTQKRSRELKESKESKESGEGVGAKTKSDGSSKSGSGDSRSDSGGSGSAKSETSSSKASSSSSSD